MLGTYKNRNAINFTNNTTSSEDFDDIYNVLLGFISENKEYLIHTSKSGSISILDPTAMRYYAINFISNTVVLHEENFYLYMYLN